MKKKIVSLLLVISTLASCLISTAYAASPTTDDIVNIASELICQKEGTYSSVVANDNGALSIGCLQWHATRALNLLKDIVKANPTNAKSLLGDALYNEIQTATAWATRILTADETAKIKSLLSTSESKTAQDALLYNDVLTYVKHGQNLGITSASALVYFADVENQCGSGGSARVFKAAQTLAGNGQVTLAILHQAALEDVAAGKSASRRNSVYEYCRLLGWDESSSAETYEVWLVTAEPSLNVRSGPGTSYAKISSYATNTEIIIYEKTTVDTTVWGRTSVGWVSLDYCKFISRHEPSDGSFPVIFNADGGTLSTTAKLTAAITGINTPRIANTLIVFTRAYGEKTGTNEYGTELIVNSEGYAQNTASNDNNSTIPTGGFVVSGHGTGATAIKGKISKGDYVVYDEKGMTLSAYTDYQSYIASNKKAVKGSAIGTLPIPTKTGYTFGGWYDENGNKYTNNTVVSQSASFTLTAKWIPVSVKVSFNADNGTVTTEKAYTTASGINVYRNTNMLVIYDNNRGATTNTNKYGSEAAVSAEGKVTAVWAESATGTGNHAIPSGGFVISGHGTMSTWIMKNISVGDCITFDRSTLRLAVTQEGAQVFTPITATYGQALGAMPAPQKSGHTFIGWALADGTIVTSKTISSFTSDITLTAQWIANGDHINGDVNEDGKVNAMDKIAVTQKIKNPDAVNYPFADVNGDGKVNAVDKVAITHLIKSKS